MIVQAHVIASVPYEHAVDRADRLFATGGLDAAAAAAVSGGQALLMRAGVAGVTKQVAILTLPPTGGPERTRIAMRWLATGPAGRLFPALDGDLEMYRAGETNTEIRLTGCYEPPFGRPGAVVDRLVMRRVAQATLDAFVHQLVALITGKPPIHTAPGALAGTG
jgi:hypothetical protein